MYTTMHAGHLYIQDCPVVARTSQNYYSSYGKNTAVSMCLFNSPQLFFAQLFVFANFSSASS